eukprot:3484302-Rhodomonas_salina.1
MPLVCPTRSRGALRVRSSHTSAGTLRPPPLVVSASVVPHSGTLLSSPLPQRPCPGVCQGHQPGSMP